MFSKLVLLAIAAVTAVDAAQLNAMSNGSFALERLFVRQAQCSDVGCRTGYSCCPAFPNSCCPKGVACYLADNGGVSCRVDCTATDTPCSFGGCCSPGSVCDDLNLGCSVT